MGHSIACPECGQVIRNALANAANKIKCGACGHLIALQTAMPGAASKDVRDARPPTHATPDAPAELREPPPANYGMLTAGAWLVAAALIAAAVADLWLSNSQSLMLSSTLINSGWVARGMTAVMALLTGLAGVRAAGLFSRLDRLACSLAWRRSEKTLNIPTLSGSNLPFMLPMMVSGGALISGSLGIVVVRAGEIDASDRTTAALGALLCALIGGGVFGLGLACSELRRFLWRMRHFGAAIRGQSFRARLAELWQDVPPHASQYLFAAMACAAGAVLTGSHDDWGAALILLLAPLMVYSAYRLSLLIDKTLFVWLPAAADNSKKNLTLLSCSAWAIVAGTAAGFLDSRTFGGSDTGFTFFVVSLLLVLLYASKLKSELHHCALGSTALVNTRPPNDTVPSNELKPMFVVAAACALVRIYSIIEASPTGSAAPALICAWLVIAIGPSWLALWVAGSVDDLSRIEKNLSDALNSETSSPALTAPATSAPVSPEQPAPASA